MDGACPFCTLASDRVVAANEHALALLDGFPIAEGHLLVIPRRHVESIFMLRDDELASLWGLVRTMRDESTARPDVDAVNIGVNDGTAAGQTVAHGHVHVIPRRAGDVADPRGGVRWIIPDKAPYWDAP